MKRWLLLISIFAVNNSMAQLDADIPDGYKSLQYIVARAGLPNLKRTPNDIHIRFFTENQGIEIWSNDQKTFYGKKVNYAYGTGCNLCDTVKKQLDYVKVESLDTASAREVYARLNDMKIFDLPVQDSIKGYQYGDDGEMYYTEFATPSTYRFKSYWSPWAQKNVKEAKDLVSAKEYFFAKLYMNKFWKDFLRTLPKGCYRTSSIASDCSNK